MPLAPRKTPAEMAVLEELITDEEKKAASLAKRREGIMKKIDWLTVNPDDPDPAMVSQLSRVIGVRLWAKKYGYGDGGEVDEEGMMAYVRHKCEEAKEKYEEESDREGYAAKVVAEASKEHLVERNRRMKDYVERIIDPQPQDLEMLADICDREILLDRLRREISLCDVDKDGLFRLGQLNTQLKTVSDGYLVLLDRLNMTKKQRDAANDGKSLAEFVLDEMKAAEKWMDAEMHFIICSCGVESTYFWYAFERVHDPLPFYLQVTCSCGKILSIGDKEFARKSMDRAILMKEKL